MQSRRSPHLGLLEKTVTATGLWTAEPSVPSGAASAGGDIRDDGFPEMKGEVGKVNDGGQQSSDGLSVDLPTDGVPVD